jgi:ribonucleoside-diphosphate reductase alpha chain
MSCAQPFVTACNSAPQQKMLIGINIYEHCSRIIGLVQPPNACAIPMANTIFTDPTAVDAWDLWFRWREGMHLHDLTIDATWERVARAAAPAEDPQAAFWAQRYVDAFSKWQMLPGEQLLHDAGTGSALQETLRRGLTHADTAQTEQTSANVTAVKVIASNVIASSAMVSNTAALNASAFVRRSRGAAAWFDRDEFMRVCGLAVRFLDDVLVAATTPMAALRIGVIGVADALAQLGVGYAGDAALAQARTIASAFSEGCMRGDVAMARERGRNPLNNKHWAARLRARDLSDKLRMELRRYGIRHPQLTAIMSHPRLALLANNTTDGLDPAVHPNGHEPSAAVHWQDTALDNDSALFAQTAQLALRAAIQPWIDRPIDTPLLALHALDENIRQRCGTLAAALKLKPPRWRLPLS